MGKEELNIKIKTLFADLDAKLSQEEKKSVHFKSISNFIYHLVDYPYINPKKNMKLQELGEIRTKKILLEYLMSISLKSKIEKEKPKSIHNTPIGKVGSFMSEYYHFSGSGGVSNSLIAIFLTSFFGMVADMITSLVLNRFFYGFTISFVLIIILRTLIKHKQRRVYGMNY